MKVGKVLMEPASQWLHGLLCPPPPKPAEPNFDPFMEDQDSGGPPHLCGQDVP